LSGKDIFSKKFYEIANALNEDPIDLIVSERSDIADVDEIRLIINAISDYKDIALVLLGSRAKGKAKKYSDWDIGVTRGSDALTGREFLKIKRLVGDLAEDLPRKVDLINLDSAPEWFLDSLDYEPLFLGGDEKTYYYFKGVIDGVKQTKNKKVA